MTLNSVFILQHSYKNGDSIETKFIGVYSTMNKAKNAMKRLSTKNGFKYYTDGFDIAKYEVDRDHWTDGFSTMTSIHVKAKSGEWVVVTAVCLPDNEYRIIEEYENEMLGEFKNGDIVKCKVKSDELYAVEKVINLSSND